MGARAAATTRKPVVLDTDVLVEHLRGSDSARRLIDSIPYTARLLSTVVRMELLHGARDRTELRRLRRFLDSAFGGGTVHVSAEISRRALALVERHALAHRMAPADALIAATALTANAAVATGNVRHFDFVSSLAIIPFAG